MKRRIAYTGLLLALLYSACAPSRYVRPLEKKQQAVTANFGGPMIGFSGAVIPIPLTAVGYGYGLDSNTTVYGNLHTTSLLFGVVQTDIGICRSFYRSPNGFGLTGNLAGNFTFDKWEKKFRAWPELDLNAYKTFNAKGSYVYAGADAWFELSKFRVHDQPQQVHLLFNPHAGVNFAKTKWNYQLEAKFIAPNIRNLPNVVDYKGISHHGALGIYFGVYRLF